MLHKYRVLCGLTHLHKRFGSSALEGIINSEVCSRTVDVLQVVEALGSVECRSCIHELACQVIGHESDLESVLAMPVDELALVDLEGLILAPGHTLELLSDPVHLELLYVLICAWLTDSSHLDVCQWFDGFDFLLADRYWVFDEIL